MYCLLGFDLYLTNTIVLIIKGGYESTIHIKISLAKLLRIRIYVKPSRPNTSVKVRIINTVRPMPPTVSQLPYHKPYAAVHECRCIVRGSNIY